MPLDFGASALEGKTTDDGILVTKENTCNGNGAQTDNLFTITGTVDILNIWAVCTEATNATTISNNSLAIYDGTNTVELTDSNSPTDFAGINVGDCVFKNGASGTIAIVRQNNDATVLTDLTQTKARVTKKLATATYIRHLFTGDANTDVDVKWYVRYLPVSDDGEIAAV